MRFDLIDWALLVLVSAIAFAATRLAVALGMVFGLTRDPVVLSAAILLVLTVDALAPWLILRTCVGDLRLRRWLLANALGAVLAIGLLLAFRSLSGGEILSDPLLLGPIALFISSLSLFAANVAYYLPPGLLLQRLSGTNAWPFIIAGAAPGLVAMLIGTMLIGSIISPRGGLGLVLWGVAVGLGHGAISGLSLGAGLFLMARQSAGTRTGA